jgi:hypothetical protein
MAGCTAEGALYYHNHTMGKSGAPEAVAEATSLRLIDKSQER